MKEKMPRFRAKGEKWRKGAKLDYSQGIYEGKPLGT